VSLSLAIKMNEYRITKYDPCKRNNEGHYTDLEEWTDYSEVGNKVSLDEYEKIENAYIESAFELINDSGCKELKVSGLEDFKNESNLKEHQIIPSKNIRPILQAILRNKFWCRLESENSFIHFGWDFYMYIGVSKSNESTIKGIEQRGLFVEKFISPYHPENC